MRFSFEYEPADVKQMEKTARKFLSILGNVANRAIEAHERIESHKAQVQCAREERAAEAEKVERESRILKAEIDSLRARAERASMGTEQRPSRWWQRSSLDDKDSSIETKPPTQDIK